MRWSNTVAGGGPPRSEPRLGVWTRRGSSHEPGHNRPVRGTVTIRDVARLAEVHPGTVSRALNEQTRALVNEETAERVLRVAEELGYRPNPIARGLKTNRSYTVGVLIPDLTNPLFPPIMRGIEDRLGDAGYTALIVNTDNDPGRERSQMDAMRARQVDGFIAATARLDTELLADVAAGGAPHGPGQPQPRGRLVGGGHRRRPAGHPPGGHTTSPSSATGSSATSAARRTCRRATCAISGSGRRWPNSDWRLASEQVVFAGAFTEANGQQACAELLDRAPGVTAVVAANDRLAIGCYDALEARGLACPGDLSVTGFNDMPFVDRLRPPLTSVRVPQREIGTVAADLLLSQLSDDSREARQILLEPTLIVRSSTAPPASPRSPPDRKRLQ